MIELVRRGEAADDGNDAAETHPKGEDTAKGRNPERQTMVAVGSGVAVRVGVRVGGSVAVGRFKAVRVKVCIPSASGLASVGAAGGSGAPQAVKLKINKPTNDKR